MAINKVSNISSANNYRVSFKGKNNITAPVINKFKSLKIPVAAALFAMMVPTGVSALNNSRNTEPAEVSASVQQAQSERVIAIATESKGLVTGYSKGSTDYKEKSVPIYGECQIKFISTDGNDNDAEIVRLHSVRDMKGNVTNSNGNKVFVKYKQSHDVDVETLYRYNILDDNDRIISSEFYILGKGLIVNGDMKDSNGNVVRRGSAKEFNDDKMEISEDCFSRLKQVMGNQVKYKTDNKKNSEIYDEISKALSDMFGI